MDKSEHFNEFRRQSKAGIVIIYLNQLYKTLKTFWVLFFFAIQKISKTPDVSMPLVYFVIGFFLIFFLIRSILVYQNFQFKIENQCFILKRGILKKTNTSVSFDRIQNINFNQNLIQQFINVYEVQIETAGSTGAEIVIKALSFKEATKLKESISLPEHLDLKTPEAHQEEGLFLKIKFLELVKVSLTENHLRSFLLFTAILLGFYQQINDFFEGTGKQNLLDNFISENSITLNSNLFFIAVISVLFVVVAMLTSVIRIFLQHFNLHVYIKNATLEITQGLLTKKVVVLQKEKIQHITVSDNPIKRKLGISYISFKQAMSGQVTKNHQKNIKIVGCKIAQVLRVKQLLFPNLEVATLPTKQLDSYYKYRLYIRGFMCLALVNILFYFFKESNHIFWFNILGVPAVTLIVSVLFRKRNYAFDTDILIVRRGFIETHSTYLPFFKVQTVCLKQTAFQARNKVADLVFQTASGKIILPCIQINKALELYDFVLFKIATSKQSWM